MFVYQDSRNTISNLLQNTVYQLYKNNYTTLVNIPQKI